MYRVYFREDEIERTQEAQSQDLFRDLLLNRDRAVVENNLNLGKGSINILDFAPAGSDFGLLHSKTGIRGGIKMRLG